jgi:hypothetical protein
MCEGFVIRIEMIVGRGRMEIGCWLASEREVIFACGEGSRSRRRRDGGGGSGMRRGGD